MRVKIVMRGPGERVLKEVTWDAIPKEGDSLIVDSETMMTVHTVMYDLRDNSVLVVAK